MSRSFFNGTESELFGGAQVFATRISAAPAMYGLSSGQAESFAALNLAFREAYAVANSPATRCPATVIGKNDAKAALKAMASQLAKIVAGTRSVSDAQRAEIGLSVRAAPSPMRPLGRPDKFKLTLDGNGDVKLTWKCHNPRGANGTMYQVYRQIDGVGAFERVGCVGKRAFTDSAVPAGSACVAYRVQAIRSTGSGDWGMFIVNFGKPPSAIRNAASPADASQNRLAA
jgi:hypothetical protein